MSILVITTGGTIGAMPYEDIRRAPKIKTMPADGTDIVRTILGKDFPGYDFSFVTMEHRDSNFIDKPYRKEILGHVERSFERNAMITHGTDTILETAEFLYHQRLSIPALRDKTVLLVGAMVALSCGPESDGFRNINFALERLSQPIAGGVYIVLSDFTDIKSQTGWEPRLYVFKPGKYGKLSDTNSMHRARLYLLMGKETDARH